MRTCRKCNKIKELSELVKNKRCSDGRDGYCKECDSKRGSAQQKANPEKCRSKQRAWCIANKEHIKIRNRIRREIKKEQIKNRVYEAANRGKLNAKEAKRRAKKLHATPPWLTEEHFKQIKNIYELAKKLEDFFGFPMEVDHEIPLQGENICGLHVPWNLLIMTREENNRKSNYFDPEVYNDMYFSDLKAIIK